MIAVEARKQVRRLRTYVGFAIVALIPVILTAALKANPPEGHRQGAEEAFFRLATQSGLNLPIAALSMMSGFLLVIVVCLFAGETVAGEASWGTLRYLLVRPVRRGRLLRVKLGVASLLALAATVTVTAVALIAGTVAFGWHPVITPTLTTMSTGTALWRLVISTAYVAWGMAAFVSFAFMLSTMTDTPFGAVAGGVGLAIVSQILDGISALGSLRYAMPSHYLDAWHALFQPPVNAWDMLRGAVAQAGYAALFLGLAWWWFNRKDVLS